jgi:hypothetical protein
MVATEAGTAVARCVSCHEEISVPVRYAHGDHIKCGVCGTNHKVVRGDRLRLVLADVAPLREALAQNQQMINRLEADLAQARGSFGIGANGIGIGVIFALYQLGLKGATLDTSLLINALAVAVVSGLALEAANWSFLAKRHALTRLSQELEAARAEGARLRQQIRDATRV